METLPIVARVSAFDRHVGGFAARCPHAMRRLGDLETRVLGADVASLRIERPVYVCGLARAGTTMLLELLAAAPGLTSHHYSDYPLLWTPYWWNWLRLRLPLPRRAPVERAHRDRLAITADSPEAFEEAFWMHFFPGRHDPGVDQVLDENCLNTAFATFYTSHMRKLLAVRGAQRYLAKGNYNLTRIGFLRRLFPDARFVIGLREPLAHVASLVKQDRLFSAWAKADPAVSVYLARSGHFEFGPHKRAIHVGDATQASAIQACFASGRIVEGYARQWASSYGWLLTRLEADPELAAACLLVGYERLCAEPRASLASLYAHADIQAATADDLTRQWAPRISGPDYYSVDFGDADRAAITEITSPVWCELGRKV